VVTSCVSKGNGRVELTGGGPLDRTGTHESGLSVGSKGVRREELVALRCTKRDSGQEDGRRRMENGEWSLWTLSEVWIRDSGLGGGRTSARHLLGTWTAGVVSVDYCSRFAVRQPD
jgi:hypothetical protein